LLVGSIFSLQDHTELKHLLSEYRPRLTLIPSKTPAPLSDTLRRCSPVEVMKSSDFGYAACSSRLLALPLPLLQGILDPHERALKLSHVLDIDNEALVCAAGALVLWLEIRSMGPQRAGRNRPSGGQTHACFLLHLIRPLSLYAWLLVVCLVACLFGCLFIWLFGWLVVFCCLFYCFVLFLVKICACFIFLYYFFPTFSVRFPFFSLPVQRLWFWTRTRFRRCKSLSWTHTPHHIRSDGPKKVGAGCCLLFVSCFTSSFLFVSFFAIFPSSFLFSCAVRN
jgi:hypothetical protein